MPLLEPTSCHLRGAMIWRRCRIVAALGALFIPSLTARAQLYQTHTEDAAPVPSGVLRFKVTTSWTRFDERFTATGSRTLGDEISSLAFGPNELPFLAPAQSALQTLTKDPATRLSFGRLAAESDARIVRTPIALEYGVTRRFSIGFSVPIIQTRRSIALRVNPDSNGTVGFVPERLRQDAATANNAVYNGFQRASDSLGVLLTKCPTTPTANGCAAVLANTADATATRLAAQQFAQAVRVGLGVDPSTALVAPLGVLANRIDVQRVALNTSVQKYLGAGAGAATNVFVAPTPFSYIDLQGRAGVPGLLGTTLGGQLDSLHTSNRLVLGGFTLGAQMLVMDNFSTDTLPPRPVQTRVVVGGAYRFEPVFADSGRTLGVISTSEGSAIELHSAMDVMMRGFGATVAARYAHRFSQTVNGPLYGDPEAFYPVPVIGPITETAGAVFGLDVTPRVMVGDWFAINGHYGFERTGATTYERIEPDCPVCLTLPAFTPSTEARTAQRLGFGIRYSTVDSYARGIAGAPVEVSFTHLETFTGDAGVAKVRRDQIQVRLFLRIRKKN